MQCTQMKFRLVFYKVVYINLQQRKQSLILRFRKIFTKITRSQPVSKRSKTMDGQNICFTVCCFVFVRNHILFNLLRVRPVYLQAYRQD